STPRHGPPYVLCAAGWESPGQDRSRPLAVFRNAKAPTAAFALSVHLHDEDDNSLVPRVEYSSTRTTVRIVRGRLGVARSGPIAAFSRFPER
ncbi:hypothetical protein QE152_g41603, partial [Popillia japonica]